MNNNICGHRYLHETLHESDGNGLLAQDIPGTGYPLLMTKPQMFGLVPEKKYLYILQ